MAFAAHAVKSDSCWTDAQLNLDRSPLRNPATVDVAIVGAGIAGLSAAYLLAREGKKVLVLDDGRIGGGQTSVTTAHLSYVLDRRFQDLIRYHGEDHARLAAGAHRDAIDTIESIAWQEQIDCDFFRRDGYLFAHEREAEAIIDREFQAVCQLGLDGVSRLERGPAGVPRVGPCLMFPGQAQFHPLKYLSGLAQAIEKLGGRICGGSHVTRVEGGDPAHVTVDGGLVVTAQDVIVATNSPINDLIAIHTKQAPYLSYVLGIAVPRGAVPPALYWDTEDPFHYVRLQPAGDHDVMIVGGEDHKTGQADDGADRFQHLEEWAREFCPQVEQVEYAWSGQVMESADGLAFIGRNPGDDHVYVATGDSGLGMTHGTIAGRLITDLIVGRYTPLSDVFSPSRKAVAALSELASQNLNVAVQYIDWLTPGEVSSLSEIPAGQGAIMREGLSKVAVYRSRDGQITRLSAVCPHMKCVVRWNSSECTWDCPCHGSRFSHDGTVMNGPANSNLEPLDDAGS